MKIRLKAPNGARSTGIYGAGGEEYPVGHEIEVAEVPNGWAGRYDIVSGDTQGKTAIVNPAASTGYAVAEKSPGWFHVTKDGQPVTKAMRRSDLEGFEEMSDEDKAAFADLHKQED